MWAQVAVVQSIGKHLFVARDEKEITVVTAPENVAELDVVAVNPDRWLLLSIDCAHPFYCVGFIAKLSAALTEAGLDILVVSTFSRDWVFVKEADAERAAHALERAGFTRAQTQESGTASDTPPAPSRSSA